MNTPFFVTREDRVSLARNRYFEEGILPTGVVSEVVFQSWTRCHRSNQKPQDKIEFQPVSVSRSQLALQKNRGLHEAWLNEMPALGTALGSANCSAILTDASGVLIGATPSGNLEQRIIPMAHRIGVNLSEEYIGTTAPGLVARTGKQACVMGAEHYFDSVSTMYCTAAPIRNIHGQLAGILDISSEGVPFKFDPSSVVGLYAASIENRLLVAQSNELLIIKFQFIPAIIETPMVGMLGFDLAGQLVWINSVASHLLGIAIPPEERNKLSIEDIFEASFEQLASNIDRGFESQRLCNGLHVFVTCSLQKQGAYAHKPTACVPPYKPDNPSSEVSCSAQPVHRDLNLSNGFLPPDSLKQADADLIRKCLAESRGNVTQAAKRLKVSRGLIYRRLQELGIDPMLYKK
jgi:transcriptional regulator of acetoin/glycerol metabolism